LKAEKKVGKWAVVKAVQLVAEKVVDLVEQLVDYLVGDLVAKKAAT
jgi:hypothetical protein